MWQLRERWPLRVSEEPSATEEVHLGSPRLRRLLIVLATLIAAAAAGYAGSHAVRPVNYIVTSTAIMGGAATALLLVAIPAEAWRLLLKTFIGLSLHRKQRRLRGLVARERSRLNRLADHRAGAPVLRDLAAAEYLYGSPETAEADLARGLEADPSDGGLLNNLGVAVADQGHYDRAAEQFVRAANGGNTELALTNCALVAPLVDPAGLLEQTVTSATVGPRATAFNNIGVSYARRSEWNTAEQWFVAAMQVDGALPAAIANLGLIAYHRGQLQEAADRISQADHEAPKEPAFANYLGVILAAAGQTDRARAYLKRAQRADPASPGIRLNALAVEALADHWSVAVRGFRALVAEHPALADGYYNLAVAELATHEAGAASVSAASAVAHGDESSDAYTLLAVSLWETGRRAEALSHFASAAQAPDAGPLAACNLGRVLMLEGYVEKAVTVLTEAGKRWSDDHYLNFDLATARLARGATKFQQKAPARQRQELLASIEGCYSGLERAAAKGSDTAAEAHLNLCLYYYMHEQYEGAAEHLNNALKLVPRTAELHFLAGTVAGRAGEEKNHRLADGSIAPTPAGRELLRQALPHLEEACQARDVLVDSSYNLGLCLYILQDYERALAAFRGAVRFENSEEVNSLAALSAARLAQASQLTVRTQLLMPEARREQLRMRTAELLTVAVHFFRQALLRNELNAVLHGNLGIAYMLRNQEHDVEAALRHWERMRTIGGGAMEKRYAQLSQMENLSEVARVGFDDRNLRLRNVDVLRWLAVVPPRPSGLRFVIEPIAVRQPWRLVADGEGLREALALRDQIAAGRECLARLRV